MTVAAQSPAAAVFGYEVADDQSQNKNLLSQCADALVANGVPVALPGGGTFQSPALGNSDSRAGDPFALEKEFIDNLFTSIATVSVAKAALTLSSVTPAAVLVLTALVAGNGGNLISVVVGTGTSSGKKITITPGANSGLATEVYDNVVDTGNAFVAAIQGVSLIVSAALSGATGSLVPVSISSTPLAGGSGCVVIAPTFAPLGKNATGTTRLDDGSSQTVTHWGIAIFNALRYNGYIA